MQMAIGEHRRPIGRGESGLHMRAAALPNRSRVVPDGRVYDFSAPTDVVTYVILHADYRPVMACPVHGWARHARAGPWRLARFTG